MDRILKFWTAQGNSLTQTLALVVPILAVMFILGAATIVFLVSDDMKAAQSRELSKIAKQRADALKAFAMARREITATPCTSEFASQLNRIAFLPDGLNEFLYAPQGTVQCGTTVHKYDVPIELGPAEAAEKNEYVTYWFDKDLSFLGRHGSRGTIVKQGDYAAVFAPFTLAPQQVPWIKSELVAIEFKGVRSLSGEAGLYAAGMDLSGPRSSSFAPLKSIECGPDYIFCMVTKADVWVWMSNHLFFVAAAGIFMSGFGWLAASTLARSMARYLAFDARFLRTLSPETLQVVYQPIMDIATGRIMGCEALARFRDVGGSIASPDRFIEIVVRSGRTLSFSRMMVEKAYRELSAIIPGDWHLQVNFNIFPRDLENPKFLQIFKPFLEANDPRFSLAAEIVEAEELNMDVAPQALRTLSSAGIRTYIDDFGAGYSSIENVATLSVDGVKLDRSFAMAPTDSVMGRMFVQVLQLIETSGRPVVVEGVEANSQLEMLKQTGLAQYAQGYCISRPLAAQDLADRIAKLHGSL